ncbi:MAG: methyl-accepting chemotaxis protein, partial [Chromatiaceae bacterium]|nr:methyl-accepting chemotaxis protein [Chromatiaceae bacterium]
MKTNLPVTGKEQGFAETDNILSTTDLKGGITAVNQTFIQVSGFNEDELIGKNHNVVRHPDMPPAAFENLWSVIQAGRTWMGPVKNRCKNGDHYWVDAFVNPIKRDGKVEEYQSVRIKPARALVDKAEALYAGMREGRLPLALRLPALGVTARLAIGLTMAAVLVFALTLALGFDPLSIAIPLGAALLLALAALWFETRPLMRLRDQARAIVNNPLTQYLYTNRRDEYGLIDFAMRMLATETRATAVRVTDSASALADHAEQMVQSVRQARAAILDQQAQTDQVATAVEEMSASVREVAQNAQHTADAAHEADGEANTGRQVVLTAGEAITALAQGIEQAAGVIHSLEQRSDEISSVLD